MRKLCPQSRPTACPSSIDVRCHPQGTLGRATSACSLPAVGRCAREGIADRRRVGIPKTALRRDYERRIRSSSRRRTGNSGKGNSAVVLGFPRRPLGAIPASSPRTLRSRSGLGQRAIVMPKKGGKRGRNPRVRRVSPWSRSVFFARSRGANGVGRGAKRGSFRAAGSVPADRQGNSPASGSRPAHHRAWPSGGMTCIRQAGIEPLSITHIFRKPTPAGLSGG